MPDMENRIASLEREIDQVRSEAAISAVLYRYCRAADRCDEELMFSCYHPGAVDDHGFFSGPAKDFVPLVIRELRKIELSVHSISNVAIQRDGEQAFVESYYSVIHRIRHFFGYTDFWHHGRYLDVFERRDGVWKIAARVIVQDGERWLQTANLKAFTDGKPNTPLQGTQSLKTDPSKVGFDLLTIIKVRPSIENLWHGFKRLALAPLVVIRVITVIAQLISKPFKKKGG